MKNYIYTDNTRKYVVFSCVAENIKQADEAYKFLFGDVTKQPHIGCQIKELKDSE